MGFARGISGGVGNEKLGETRFGKGTYREYTDEERKAVYRKAMIGTGAAVALFLLSEPGDNDEEPLVEITSNGYGDYKKNYELQEKGWQKYSIKIGNKWFSYQYTPLVLALAPIGYYRDEEKYNKKRFDKNDAVKNMGMAYFKSLSVMGDMTWVTQLTGLLDALKGNTLSEVENYFSRIGVSTAKSVVYPKLAEQTVQLVDYMQENPRRAASTSMGKIMKDIPIVRNKYNVMLNAVGQPVMYDPFQMVSSVDPDPFWQYVNDHNINIGKPDQKDSFYDDITKTERTMTDGEYFEFISKSGPEIQRRIETELMPKEMDDEDIKKEVENIKSEVRKAVKTEMFGWGEFRKAHPEDWQLVVKTGALQVPQTSLQPFVYNDERIEFSKEELARFNELAMERYGKKIIPYLKKEEWVKKSKENTEATPQGIISKFEIKIDEKWAEAKASAREQVIRERKAEIRNEQ